MASNTFVAVELITTFSIACTLLCPVLCWAISGQFPWQEYQNGLGEQTQWEN